MVCPLTSTFRVLGDFLFRAHNKSNTNMKRAFARSMFLISGPYLPPLVTKMQMIFFNPCKLHANSNYFSQDWGCIFLYTTTECPKIEQMQYSRRHSPFFGRPPDRWYYIIILDGTSEHVAHAWRKVGVFRENFFWLLSI